MGLNKSQIDAVNHGRGPCMTLAGPGSGKTTVITNRIFNLINNQGINPSNILVITFTKAASIEMKERFLAMCKNKPTQVTFGTFHAVFFKILKYAYNYNASNIIRDEEKKIFFKQLIQKYTFEVDDEAELLQNIESEISKIKNNQIQIENYYSTNAPAETFREIYNEYNNFLQRKRCIDFDDMLVYCYELFKARKDILKLWQNKYQYILIDEFQDINKLQYKVVQMLALPENNLFIVGDDDQSIYRFRGANPSIMLNFEKDYPDAKKILLNVNYRCGTKIINGARRLISNNKQRFDKEIMANSDSSNPIFIKQFSNVNNQVSAIIEEILVYNARGVSYKDIAVLCRTNTQPGLLVQRMMEYNIPFKMKDIMPNIYEHWIVKNIKAYIRIANGGSDRSDYIQIINRPNRYIGRDALEGENITIESLMNFYLDKDWMLERIDNLQYDLAAIAGKDPYSSIQYIRRGIEYDSYIHEYAQYKNINEQELFDLIDEVQENSKEFATCDEWFDYMEKYKEQLNKQALERNEKSDAVVLSTMHASKGLEYKAVFIPDANEGIVPHNKSVLDADIEEERRLFYVAMTRAKQFLHIYYSKERYNKQLEVSRFVNEIIGETSKQ